MLFKNTRKPRKPKRKQRKPRRSPSIERLDDRRLMAADVFVARTGALVINADHHHDEIVVDSVMRQISLPSRLGSASRSFSYPMLRVTSLDETGDESVSFFSAFTVKSLEIDGGGGDDRIDVRASLPSYIQGGSGDDRIYGGPLDDIIEGESGNDRLYGRDGDDKLSGSFGNDRLYGHDGDDELNGGGNHDWLYGGDDDDVLRGGSGNDRLRGNYGHDRLLGEFGDDDLEGSNGNDVLIGGLGADDLDSGSGRDRFLVMEGQGDLIRDFHSNNDAQLFFADSIWDASVPLASNIGWVTAKAKDWSMADVEKVDESLQTLFEVTGNNKLLKKADGGSIKFVRYGEIFDGSGEENTSVLGWNGGGEIVILDNAIDGSQIQETVIHEVGHYFDEQGENPFINEYREAAGWVDLAPWDSTAGMTIARDKGWHGWFGGGWHYPTNRQDEFARNYGRMNPLEDWATAFTAKVLSDAGHDYMSESAEDVQDRMGDGVRFEILDDFFASLS